MSIVASRATLRTSRLAVAVLAATVPLSLSTAVAGGPPLQATDLDTIEVRGERVPLQEQRRLTPGGVTVLDGESFHQRPVANLADALRYVPGTWAVSSAGGDSLFISSRGSNLDATHYDSNGVKLFQDGLPVSSADGNNHNRFLDPLAARHAVVARGANALSLGASNLGGGIDFVSPTARNGAPRQLSVSGGSHGTLGARVTAGGVSGDRDGLVTLETRRSRGHRAHARQERAGLYANAGWQPSQAFDLRVFATYIDSEEELAGALDRVRFDADPRQADPSAVSGNFQLNVRSRRLAAKATWDIGDGQRLEFGLSHETQHLYHPIVDKVMVERPPPLPPIEVFSLLKQTDQDNWGGMLRYRVRTDSHDVLAGINLGYSHETGGNFRNDGGRRNGLTGTIDNRSDSVEVFVLDRWGFAPGWTAVYGAQGVITGRDVRTGDPASGTLRRLQDEYSAINPRLGVIRALGPGREAFASLGVLYEAPTTMELEDDARGGGATLDAMRGAVLEFGLRGETAVAADAPRWHWDASVYYARIRDAILSVDDPDAPGTSLSTNIDRTIHAGVEVLAGADIPLAPGHRIEPLLSATWNAFSFDDDPVYGNNRLPAAPAYVLRGEVLYRNDSGFFAGPTFDLVGRRYADFGNGYRVGSHALMGLRTGIARGGWEAFAGIRNVFDRRHVGMLLVRDHAGPGAPVLHAGEPRSVHVGMRVVY